MAEDLVTPTLDVVAPALDRMHPTDKDLFLNALGALLAATMESDRDEDHCERAL